jgi:bifunctional non-homologous end joining protein LigD
VNLKDIHPMLATSAAQLREGEQWSYEVKWDGYHTLAVKDGARVTLLSRNLKDATAQYPRVARAVAQFRDNAAVLDGEIVTIDEHDRPSFQALHHQAAHTIVFYAFDLLRLNGNDLTRLPLEQRRAALAQAVKGTRILRSEPLPGTRAQIEFAVREFGLEGVVAETRLPLRIWQAQQILGEGEVQSPTGVRRRWLQAERGRLRVTSNRLLPGPQADVRQQGQSGADAAHPRGTLPDAQGSRFSRKCPFANLPSNKTGHWGEGITAEDMSALRWVKPKIVVEVSFVEWTRDGLLRHPEFIGIRNDKDPRAVKRET